MPCLNSFFNISFNISFPCCSALFPLPAAMPFLIMTIVFRPYQRGIYCDDESIRYPYKSDTISHGMMAAITISCSIIIVSY